MREAELDYRFGWRWLLPLQGCERVFFEGFDDLERRYWRAALALRADETEPHAADAWIIDADRAPPRDLVRANTKMVGVVGAARAIAAWREALADDLPARREYGLLPPRNPRVVVPLDSGHALPALRVHRPGRMLARAAMQFAGVLACAGILAPLRRRSLLIALRDPDAVPTGAAQAEMDTSPPGLRPGYALYLGTPDENRKTIVLPLGAGVPRCILKVAVSREARRSLKKEADALEVLRGSCLARNVPRVTRQVENAAALTLYEQYDPPRPTSARSFEAAVVHFLAALSRMNRRERAACGHHMPLFEHRAHGDFARWNCTWTEHGLLVYDWEESRNQDLAFGDALHYVVSSALLVGGRRDARRTLRKALEFAARVADAAGLERALIRPHVALWLRQRLPKAPLFGAMLHALEEGE